ncbi:MAG: hypothetical protein ABC360_06290 [Acetomicrobium sp.]
MTDVRMFDVPGPIDIMWCPGCGNFPILDAVKKPWPNSILRPKTC